MHIGLGTVSLHGSNLALDVDFRDLERKVILFGGTRIFTFHEI
jgi:hypothetical protein